MSKKVVWLSAIFSLILFLFCLSGCGIVIVKGVAVKDDVVVETEMGKLDCSSVTLIVNYSDNTTEEVALTDDMISDSERLKLYKEGEQKLTINYLDVSCNLDVIVHRRSLEDVISFEDQSFPYDGKSHSLRLTGDVPESAVVLFPNGNAFSDAGEYEVKAVISCDLYETVTMTAKLTIEKSDYDISFFDPVDTEFTYDGSIKTIVPEEVPKDVLMSYTYYESDGKTRINAPVAVGTYYEVVHYSCSNNNYNPIPNKTIKIVINPADYKLGNVEFPAVQVTYNEQPHYASLANPYGLPRDVSVSYEYYYFGLVDSLDVSSATLDPTKKIEDPIKAGMYVACAILTSSNPNYLPIEPIRTLMDIKPIKINLEHLSLKGSWCDYDSQLHSLEVTGNVPDSVKVTMSYNGEVVEGVKLPGNYTVNATFSYDADGKDPDGYTFVPDRLEGTLIIKYVTNPESLTVNPNDIVYNDEAEEGEDKFTILGLPETVRSTVTFYENGSVVSGDRLERGKSYSYSVSLVYVDECDAIGYPIPVVNGEVYFKNLFVIEHLSNVTMPVKTAFYDGEEHVFKVTSTLPDNAFCYEYAGVSSVGSFSAVEAGDYEVVISVNEDLYEFELGDDLQEPVTVTISILLKKVTFAQTTLDEKIIEYDGGKYVFDPTARDSGIKLLIEGEEAELSEDFVFSVKYVFFYETASGNTSIEDSSAFRVGRIVSNESTTSSSSRGYYEISVTVVSSSGAYDCTTESVKFKCVIEYQLGEIRKVPVVSDGFCYISQDQGLPEGLVLRSTSIGGRVSNTSYSEYFYIDGTASETFIAFRINYNSYIKVTYKTR